MLLQNTNVSSPTIQFLPGFEAYDFKNWNAPKAADVEDGLQSSEDDKLEKVITNSKLKLSEQQQTAVRQFVETVANETTATFGGIPEFEKLSKIKCHDYGDQKGGRCEVALQQGSDAHLIRFGWIYSLDSEKGEEAGTVQFGITCLKKIKGLSHSEITLIRGLNRWVKDSSVRWLRKQLQNAIKKDQQISDFTADWRKGFDFDNFQRAMQRILSDPNRFAMSYSNEQARVRFAGRTISACKAAALLLSVNLPVPHEIVNRVLRGARRLFKQ